VLACWLLSAFVLVNAYASLLISHLMLPKLLPVSKSFEDLASGHPQRLQLMVEKNQFLANGIFLVIITIH